MKSCYIDTSILVGITLQQKNYQDIWLKLRDMNLFSHELLVSEFMSVGKRENISLGKISQELQKINFVTEIPELELICDRILKFGYCRGADLHHLACACFLDPSGEDLFFASADQKQVDLAKKLGFACV